jgi:hypothetical protein
MSFGKVLGSVIGLTLVILFVVGCGGAPTAAPIAEAPAATPTAEPPTATPGPASTPTPASLPTPSGGLGYTGSWNDWSITWNEVEKLKNIKSGVMEQTYTPEQNGYSFLVVKTKMKNSSTKPLKTSLTAEKPVFVMDAEGKVYNLAGLQSEYLSMIAPPYMPPTDFPIADSFNSAKGGFSVAYDPGPKTWYIEATQGVEIEVKYVFVVPTDANELVMYLEGGPTVNLR